MNSETSSEGVYTEYTFDEENRLISVVKDDIQTAAYTYDGDGGRTSKTVNGVQTKFIGSMYEERGASQTEHIFVGSMRIASITDGVISFHHADHLGGLNVITDDAGAIKEVVEYKPFGEFATREKFGGGADVAWHYFTGQHYDAETELYFYNARYYNPKLGRFIQADTIVPYASDSQSLNRYSYVRNNPVNLVDPSGHFFFAVIVAIVKAVAAFAVAHPVITAGIISAGVNVGFNASNIHNFGDFVRFAAIGYASGAAGAGAGLSIASGLGRLGVGSFWAGVGATAGGGAVGGFTGGTGNALATGADFGDAIKAGAITAAYAAVTSAGLYAVGYGISKVVEKIRLENAAKRVVGTQQTIGAEQNTLQSSLDIDGGAQASSKQALRLKPNYDVEGQIVSYDLVPEQKFNSPNFVVDSSGQAFPVPNGASGPHLLPSGKNTGVMFSGGQMGVNGQVDNIRIMSATPPMGNSPGHPNGYVVYGNRLGQSVNPFTGRTVSDAQAHYPLNR